jgi:hypothetical protein
MRLSSVKSKALLIAPAAVDDRWGDLPVSGLRYSDWRTPSFLAWVELDLLRKSGEFPVSNEELDETATTVYKGI